ncbi:hypothetical protein CRUP_001830 [Coryphaenoides rupestris]|nr:hypothetical protein CRUP_001830 [Coryphaenoides rupestris]
MEATICNIQVLLQAAEFLERREREAEHGLVHNELEKNRRAQLRFHLEQLKQQVPLSSDSMRNTTLNLLRRAQLHIKKLQQQDQRAEQLKGRLRWEQRELQDVEVDVESIVFECVSSDGLSMAHTGVDHCYSSLDKDWL